MTLRSKILYVTAAVVTVVTLVVGLMMYTTQVAPVEKQAKQRLTEQMQTFINAKLDLKVQAGIIGATMFSLKPEVKQALKTQQLSQIRPQLRTLREDYANKTNFRGIFTEVIDAQGQSLLRSWKVDAGAGDNRRQDPLIKAVMQEKQAQGAFGFGERGVSITAASPVLEDDRLLGVVTMVAGVGSISRDFKSEVDGSWIMLVDSQYVKQKFGSKAPIDHLKPIDPRYVQAHNRWFAPEVVRLAKQVYQPIHGDQTQVYLSHDKVIVDLPAYDETGQVFGRQLFIQDQSVLTQPMNAAFDQAWQSLLSVVIGILVLASLLYLLIGRLVIRPLTRLNQTMANIKSSGDFSLRSDIQSQDEVGQTAQAINAHLDNVSHALDAANTAVAALAKGDLHQRITGNYHGDLARLQSGINQSFDNVASTIDQIHSAVDALAEGQFDRVLTHQAQGDFAKILDQTQASMQQIKSVMDTINQVMAQVAQGQLENRVAVDAKGELAVLKTSVNDTMDILQAVIEQIAQVMQAQSQGDLTQRVAVDCEGDFRHLRDAVNENARHLNQVIRQVLQAAQVVTGASEEVSRGATNLSDSVQKQAASMEQTTATMHEMNDAIRQNAGNAKKVDKLDHELEQSSKSAGEVMHQTIEAMTAIQDSSGKIREIVDMIDSIAFQTNLLALNAAVEAARAGEHGRGFAVVAGEVRALAQKSANAAKDISHLIKESLDRINRGTDLAGDSEKVLTRMNDSILEVTGMIGDIANTSAEQAKGVDEINKALESMDDVTQQNAALVEQTSAASESLREQAEALQKDMAFFHTQAVNANDKQAAQALPKPRHAHADQDDSEPST